MVTSTQQNGILSFRDLVIQLTNAMTADDKFELAYVDQTPQGTIDSITNKVYLKATSAVDPIADTQPWGVVIEFNDGEQWLDIYITPPEQIIINTDKSWRVAVKQEVNEVKTLSGKLTTRSEDANPAVDGSTRRTLSYINWGIQGADTAAYPFSFEISTTAHGFSLSVWAESTDSDGDKFTWAICQRMVNDKGEPITTGKAPLFCVFANQGFDKNDIYTTSRDAIKKFVVRESDVNAPTIPVSAVEDTADSSRIINNKQQVSIREGNEIALTFPNGLTTPRYGYDTELDLIGIISSDVISQSSELVYNPFGESTDRVYRGMNADRPYNSGMRVMFWVSGGD